MTLKVFYFNDTKAQQSVYTGTLEGPPATMHPGTGRLFEFEASPGAIPFVKSWGTTVLIAGYGASEDMST